MPGVEGCTGPGPATGVTCRDPDSGLVSGLRIVQAGEPALRELLPLRPRGRGGGG